MQAKILALLVGRLSQEFIILILVGLLEKLRPVVETTSNEVDNHVLDCLLATLREHVKTE